MCSGYSQPVFLAAPAGDINGSIYLLAAAVPEPAGAALLAAGLAALGLFTRRRRA